MDISIRVHTDSRPRGDGIAVRVVEVPIYTFVKTMEELEGQLTDALQIWGGGFPTAEALLQYLRDNEIEHTVREDEPSTSVSHANQLRVSTLMRVLATEGWHRREPDGEAYDEYQVAVRA